MLSANLWIAVGKCILISFFFLHGFLDTLTAGMAGTAWLKGRVKAVPSGDCMVISALTYSNAGPPPEKTITLSSLIAPRLVSATFTLSIDCVVSDPFLHDGFVSPMRPYLLKEIGVD